MKDNPVTPFPTTSETDGSLVKEKAPVEPTIAIGVNRHRIGVSVRYNDPDRHDVHGYFAPHRDPAVKEQVVFKSKHPEAVSAVLAAAGLMPESLPILSASTLPNGNNLTFVEREKMAKVIGMISAQVSEKAARDLADNASSANVVSDDDTVGDDADDN